jgi:DNA-binding winged helix-turn-helix (wHTH) protein/tetratricopeptide (TPR) repeat protein
MSLAAKHLYEFGPFRMDPPERLLEREGHPVAVTPKAFDILVTLVERSGHLVEKSQLIQAVWKDSFVEEGNLAVTISALRKALGDDTGKESKYIQTVPKRGYRFVGNVREVVESDAPGPPILGLSGPLEPLTLPVIVPSQGGAVAPRPLISEAAPNEQPRRGNRWVPSPFGFASIALLVTVPAIYLGILRLSGHHPAVATQVEPIAVQDTIVADAGRLSASPMFSSRARSRIKLSSASIPSADQLYITGVFFWNKRTVQGLRRSIEYFEQAAIQDPRNPLSFAGLADAYVLLDSYGVEPSREAYPSAKNAAIKSLQLDDQLPEAHASMGMVLFFDEWNLPRAEQEFRKAIALDPNYAMAHAWYALVLVAMGRSQEAIAQARNAHNLDPLSLIVNTELGWALYSSHQYAQAINTYKSVIDLDDGFARAHTRLGMVYAAQGDFSSAIREFRKAQGLSGPDAYVDGMLGYALARSGNTAGARKILLELRERSSHEYVPAFSLAMISLGLGDNGQAMDWISQSFQEHSTYLVYAQTDPLLDRIRKESRFSALLSQMGLSRGAESVISGK